MTMIFPVATITTVTCYCFVCDWMGQVGSCETDIDGDGSLGCPVCKVAEVVIDYES